MPRSRVARRPISICTQIADGERDIAGHERFGYMTRVYYKYASAAAVVFDVSRGQTFESLERWLGDVKDKIVFADGEPIPVVVLANKADIPGCTIPAEQLDKLCRDEEIIDWFATSAKENLNIDDAMNRLIGAAMDKRLANLPPESDDSILLHNSSSSSIKSNRRCCS